MFILRIVVPVLAIFAFLYWLRRRLEPTLTVGPIKLPLTNRALFIQAACLLGLAAVIGIGYLLVTNQFVDLLVFVRDAVVIAYMFALRIVFPIVLLIGLGNWLQRKLNPDAARNAKTLGDYIPVLKRVQLPQVSTRARFGIMFIIVLWTAAIGIAVARFFFGLGYTTNLTDEFPWGIWIAFDVVSGVALAAGGFVMAGTVHVFNLKRYHPILRPAILTALLGYLLVIVGLLFDLGRWYNIWHPIFFLNIHSPMLEVAWCVMLYSSVLIVEFSPIVFERLRWEWALKIVRAVTIPVVIAGMVLSTLHQSSLGSLFLIFPEKINPLWYSPMLPVFFFISAVAVGLGMTIVESNLSARGFGKELESDLLNGLGRAASFVIAFYLVLRFGDLIARDAFKYAFTPGFHAMIFWIEMLIGFAIPMALMAFKRLRSNPGIVFLAGGLVVGGVIFNRLNTSLLGWWTYANGGPIYIPSLGEVTITLSIVAAGVVAFGLATKYLPVFHSEQHAQA
jgi:Ni/Fe-hydrogenase subunit HybB-like protein